MHFTTESLPESKVVDNEVEEERAMLKVQIFAGVLNTAYYNTECTKFCECTYYCLIIRKVLNLVGVLNTAYYNALGTKFCKYT